METAAPLRMKHIPALDGIRAIAILIVFIGHTKILKAFPGGLGVTVFFCLSGYLITTLLRIEWTNTRHIDLKAFYIRRFLRINPPLWLSMGAILALFGLGLISQDLDPLVLIAQAFFFVNYMPSFGQGDGLPTPLWSLAVEEHFYLLFPTIFLLASRFMTSARLATACLVACAVVLGIRLTNITAFGIVEPNYYWTHTRIDSILFGCVLALRHNPILDADAKRPPWWLVGLAGAAICATFLMKAPLLREGFRYSIQGVALVILFAWVLHQRGGPVAWVLGSAPMRLIGLYSYTLYLVHYAVLVVIWTNLPGLPTIAQGVLGGIVSMAFAAIMYAVVERPLSRLRHRLDKAKVPPADTSPQSI
jgi:peptidoglycan/LPS O-acetylase OafA/YrhL